MVDKYDNNNWKCRVPSGIDINSPVYFDLNLDNFSQEALAQYNQLKELYCHPSELVSISNLRQLKPKDDYLYAFYNNSTYDDAMDSLDEFVQVLADLPCKTYIQRITTRYGLKKVIKKSSPKVLARGETTGKFYILQAHQLWRVSGEFEVNARGEKIADKYNWHDPKQRKTITTASCKQYAYSCSEDRSSFIPEVADAVIRERMTMYNKDKLQRCLIQQIPTKKLLLWSINTTAWYWKLPLVSAKQLGFSSIRIYSWSTAPSKAGRPVAIVEVIYKGKEYKIPVYLGTHRELRVKTRSRIVAAFLCRYTTIKYLQLRHAKARNNRL